MFIYTYIVLYMCYHPVVHQRITSVQVGSEECVSAARVIATYRRSCSELYV